MKTLFAGAVMAAALALGLSALAQAPSARTSGLYLTAQDYERGRVSYQGDCASQSHKLELHDVLHKSYIHVTHAGEKKRFAKTALFGFRACDGQSYRFVSNLEYPILEAGTLYIYRREVLVSHGRGRHGVKQYYFSVGATGEIRALTLENLKQAFPENHAFQQSLDEAFGSGQKLSEYDEVRKTFKVNRLLAASREGHS